MTEVARSRDIGVTFSPYMFFLVLVLMVVSGYSQNGAAAPSAEVEILNDAQSTMVGFIIFLFAQVFVLTAIMISYLVFSARVHKDQRQARGKQLSRLRFHHH